MGRGDEEKKGVENKEIEIWNQTEMKKFISREKKVKCAQPEAEPKEPERTNISVWLAQ